MVRQAALFLGLYCFYGLRSPVVAECPAGWVHFNESCYSFVPKQITWNEAQRSCYITGGSLVIIESKEEDDFLHSYLDQERRYFYGYDFWLGGEEIPGTDAWEWVDATPFSQTFTAWASGRPVRGGRARCLEFEAELDNKWNDDFCDELDFYICERTYLPLTPAPPTVVG